MATMHHRIDAVESGFEETLICIDLESFRHLAGPVRQHAVGRHDGVAHDAQQPGDARAPTRRGRQLPSMVRTTLSTGRPLTFGVLISFITMASYSGSELSLSHARICTI